MEYRAPGLTDRLRIGLQGETIFRSRMLCGAAIVSADVVTFGAGYLPPDSFRYTRSNVATRDSDRKTRD